MLIFTRIISLVISFVIVCAVFYNVISTYVFGSANIVLFKSDPFNFQTRIQYLNSVALKPEIDSTKLETLQEIADAGTKLEPLNARILALKGAFKQRTDNEAAQQYYVKALALKPTDQIAISQRYIYLIRHNKFKEAIPLVEIISARSPIIFHKLLPTIPLLLQTEDNRDQILQKFNSRPNSLRLMIGSMVKDPKNVDLAYNLILNLHKKYNIDVHSISIPVILQLLKQGRNSDAYLLFYKTLSDEEKKNVGYIYNSDFSTKPTASYFDWIIRAQAGVNMRRVEKRSLNTQGSQKTKSGGLEIKFLNAPVAFSNVNQLLYLPKRTYELFVKYSVDDLHGPSPISVKLICNDTKLKLTEIELLKRQTTEEVHTVEFVVPKEGCEIQKVLISNNNTVESWQNRFSGKITLHEIGIKLSGS